MTTQTEALKLALEALESFVQPDSCEHGFWWEDCPNDTCEKVKDMKTITAIKEVLAQPEQEPVAMKFKIYKPTVPDPMRQDINDALLPWVYDQSRGSGFVASMWVTPVSTLPPQRTWVGLTDEDKQKIMWTFTEPTGLFKHFKYMEAIEAKLKEKNT